MKKVLLIIVALIILTDLYLRYGTKQNESPTVATVAAPVAQDLSKIEARAPFEVGDTVRIWGKEKGEVLVQEINLWLSPHGWKDKKQRIVGVLAHNTPVKIRGRQRIPGIWYFLVEAPDQGPRGWVSETQLKR